MSRFLNASSAPMAESPDGRQDERRRGHHVGGEVRPVPADGLHQRHPARIGARHRTAPGRPGTGYRRVPAVAPAGGPPPARARPAAVGRRPRLRSRLPPPAAVGPAAEPPHAAPPPRPDPLIWRHPEILSPTEVEFGPRALDGWYASAGSHAERETSWGHRVAGPLGEVGSALAYRFGQGMAAARKG